MAKDNQNKKIQLKPYTAKNVIDERNGSIKKQARQSLNLDPEVQLKVVCRWCVVENHPCNG